jgi:integrase
MFIRKLNGVWYLDFYYFDPSTLQRRRCRRSTGLGATRSNRQSALAMAAQVRSVLLQPTKAAQPEGQGKPPGEPRKRAPFSGFAKLFYDNHAVPTLRPSTIRAYEQIIRVHLHPCFGDTDLRDICVETVERFRARQLKGRSAKTVNNQLSLLSTIFAKAVQWGYCETNPVRGSMLKVPETEMMFWESRDQEAFLREVCEGYPGWAPFFVTALFTGMRLGELLALSWRDVSFDRDQILVRRSFSHGALTGTKSGKGRALPMHPRVKAALLAHRHLKGRLIFCDGKGGYLRRDMVKGPMERSIRRAGVPRIRIHDLRHTFASQAVIQGVPLPQVQQWLGHADIRTTMRYAHLAPAMGHGWIRRLGGSCGQAPQPPAAFHKSTSNDGY